MSIDVNVQNDLVIVTESSEDIVVNVSNAAGPAGANGVGVPVGGATGQVLKKFTNTDYDTYWAADASGLTSVGLSMPTAFTVSNTPLTSNGTLAVTGAGLATQYIRGDGQLATFPGTASGGSSVNYYLNGSVNASVGGYKQMANTAIIGTGTNFPLTGNGLIAQFLTDAGNPNRVEIPGGAWNFEMYFSSSSNGGNEGFYVELLKYNGTTFTSIASSSTNPESITGGTSTDLYLTSLAVPTTALLVTDRLAIRVYIVNNAAARTVTLKTEDNNLCEIITTFAGGIAALNGLTANTQYLATGTSGTDFNISSVSDTHTFNLPTASATNRGALSSADWSTFNGKVGGTGATGQVAYWNGTNSQTGSNNLFWDAANARLGINTITPSSSLQVVGTVYATDHLRFGSQLRDNRDNEIFTQSLSSVASNRILTIANATYLNVVIENPRLLLGGTTDNGNRLQVYGDAYIKGSGNTSATTALTVQNSDGRVIIKASNNGAIQVGNLTSNSIYPFSSSVGTPDIQGTSIAFSTSLLTSGNSIGFRNAQTTNRDYISGDGTFIRLYEGYAPTSGTGTWQSLVLTPTINQTGGANGITRGLYINPTLTAAADWRSIEWSNNTGWGLYGAGTAANYLSSKLSIATTNTTRRLNIEQANGGNAASIGLYFGGGSLVSVIGNEANTTDLQLAATTGIRFYSGSVIGNIATEPTNERMRLTTAGRLLLGTTTEDTYLLDVNGTARVSGALTALRINTDGLTNANNFSAAFKVFELQGTTAYGGTAYIYDGGSWRWREGTNTGYFKIGNGQSISINGIPYNSTGDYNVAIGNGAGGNGAGGSMVAIGHGAVSGQTTGVSNTGVGMSCLYNVTTGSENTAIGMYAGTSFGSNANANHSSSIFIGVANGWATNGTALTNTYIIGNSVRTDLSNVFMLGRSDQTIMVGQGSSVGSGAIFQIDSTTKGFLPPRMTTTEKNAIGTPAAGLQVYDTTLNQMSYYNGTTWINF